MHIAYFVTGHGYGHAIRSATIANKFSTSTDITFVTSIDRTFFEREMVRPFNYREAELDCGCLQPSGVSVDIPGTLERYQAIAAQNGTKLSQMSSWCREQHIDRIVSDCTPFAFDIANACSLPSVAVTNFTWYDIYREYLEEYPAFTEMIGAIEQQYRNADGVLALTPALPMTYFKNRHCLPLVGRTGVLQKEKMLSAYQIKDTGKHAGMIYIGNFGMPGAAWKKLERFEDWEFFGIQKLPCEVRNYHQIDFSLVPYPDMVASVDCVFAKLGYGVVSECLINRTPLIYLPRTNFAEYPVLEEAVEKWGGAIKITESAFAEINWLPALSQLETRNNLPYQPGDGALQCARLLEN